MSDAALASWVRSLPWQLPTRRRRRQPSQPARDRLQDDGEALQGSSAMAAIEGSARYRDLLPALRDTVAQLPDVIRELRLLVRGLGRAAQPGGDLVAVLRELSRLLAAGADRLEAGRRA